MRLYSLVGADSHVDPDGTRYTGDDAGAFDFPDEYAEQIVSFAVKGKKLWETEETRAERMHGLELARRRDPASMLTVMEENAALTRQLAEVMARLAEVQLGRAPAPGPAAPEAGPAPEPPAAPAKPSRTAKAAAAKSTPAE